MNKKLVRKILEAYAVGDACGKSTEYCTQQNITNHYHKIEKILSPQESIAHQDLIYGQVTDDTEQNVYLIKEYAKQKEITPYNTAKTLLCWIRETEAATRYIGPNSLKALQAIERGEDVTKTGLDGTTCGGIMRVLAPYFFSNSKTLVNNIVHCLMPTHYTPIAIEAAMCYAFSLEAATQETTIEAIIQKACEGAQIGRKFGSDKRTAIVGPSCEHRIQFIQTLMPNLDSKEKLKYFLYEIMGTTLASYDVCTAVMAIFMYAKKDVFLAICIATELGGDTDTIACLAAALCTAYAGDHNINVAEVELVSKTNHIDFEELSELIVCARDEIEKRKEK